MASLIAFDANVAGHACLSLNRCSTTDTTYDTEIEVLADGYRLKLVDPYNNPVLYIRRPGVSGEGESRREPTAELRCSATDGRLLSISAEVRRYDHDDPFYSEISAMVDAVEGNADSSLLSTFEDALKTYQLTWAIRRAGEQA